MSRKQVVKGAEEDDLTLNQKINKVISDIKRINDQKAKEYGCINQSSILNNTQLSQQSTKKDKLMDFIKKEQRKHSNQKRIRMLDEQEGQEDENDVSCSFDLTSAKVDRKVQQQSSQKPHYQSTQQLQTQVRSSKDKYENILAAPGSIYISTNGDYHRKTLIEDLQASDRTQPEHQLHNQSFKPEPTQAKNYEQEEIDKWMIFNQRTEEMLQKERERTLQLEQELQRNNQEKQLMEEILEEQELRTQVQDYELVRMRHKTQALSKTLVRETCLKENLRERTGYSNPAKLMNYLKMKKCQGNKAFESNNEYVSHLEAYNKITIKQSEEERQRQRRLLEQINSKNQQTLGTTIKSEVSRTQRKVEKEQNLRETLEAQRKALRDFSNYYQYNK